HRATSRSTLTSDTHRNTGSRAAGGPLAKRFPCLWRADTDRLVRRIDSFTEPSEKLDAIHSLHLALQPCRLLRKRGVGRSAPGAGGREQDDIVESLLELRDRSSGQPEGQRPGLRREGPAGARSRLLAVRIRRFARLRRSRMVLDLIHSRPSGGGANRAGAVWRRGLSR